MRIYLERIRLAIKRFIKFLEEDSILSDLFLLLLIFVLFKFAFYPLFSYAMGTPYPVVIVMSESMEHSNFNASWYIKNGFSEDMIKNMPYSKGLNVGDVLLIKGYKKCSDYKIGDVAVYKIDVLPIPIVHRIVKIYYGNSTCYFTFKGDNNPFPLPFEKNISIKNVYGKPILRIPYVGLPKVYLLKIIRSIE